MASKTVRGRRGCSQCGDRWGGRSGDKTWHPLGKAAAARTAWVALVASDGGGTPSGSPDKPRSVMTLASRGTFPWASRDQVRTSPGEPSGNRRRNSPYGVSGEVSVTCGHCGAVGYALWKMTRKETVKHRHGHRRRSVWCRDWECESGRTAGGAVEPLKSVLQIPTALEPLARDVA